MNNLEHNLTNQKNLTNWLMPRTHAAVNKNWDQ